MGDPKLKADADSAYANSESYFAINGTMKPFDNLDCRQAVEWITDKNTMQTQLGGPIAGGDIATTAQPPTVPGWVKEDQYATTDHKGDATKAKASLAKCQSAEPDQFNADGTLKTTYEITIRDNADREEKIAETLQNNLKSIGIQTTIDAKPFNKYNADFAGNRQYSQAHKVAISFSKWGWDFPTGYGYMYGIFAGSAIHESGNYVLSWMDDKAVDQGFETALAETDKTKRDADYAAIDHQIMSDALIVPIVYNKELVYRPETLTNVVFSQALGMYYFSAMGVK